jgi:hypothetical protein
MKRILISITCVLINAIFAYMPAYGQRFEAIPFFGYQTGGKIEAYEGSFRVTNGLSTGASLNFKFKEGYKVEVSYNRTASEFNYSLNGNTQYLFDIAVHYISIAALAEINPEERTVPFFKVGVGRTIYQPLTDSISSENVMHFDVSGGVKFLLSRHVGLRLQASLLLPVFFEGMYFEEAAPPPGQGVKTELSGIQGNISAGVLFRF